MDMLRISGLHKRFGDKTVLNGLELTVPEHSIFGFIGKNGAGKTTTMKTVLGLLKADAGGILVNGEQVVYGGTSTNRHIGYLPDVPEFYPFMTAPEYLRFCGSITGLRRQETEARSRELLELVGLAGETHRIKGFSRGMKQRLGIAQALLNRPKLLICDEPTSALDPVGRKEILELLQSVKDRTTILFSTHILSDVERICTDVAFLDQGTVKLQGKLSQLRSSREYLLELRDPRQAAALTARFPGLREEDGKLRFREQETPQHALLAYLAENRIGVMQLLQAEQSLESLFLEVAE